MGKARWGWRAAGVPVGPQATWALFLSRMSLSPSQKFSHSSGKVSRLYIARCLQHCVQCLCLTASATLQTQQPALEEETPCLGTAGLSQCQAGGGHAYWDPRASAGAFKLLRLYLPLSSQAVKGLEQGWIQHTLTDLFPGSGPVLGSGDMKMMMRRESS